MAVAVATVLIVSYNGADLLRRCLDALSSQTMSRESFEVCVVDNASVDGTAELVTTTYPWVRLLSAPSNLGFAGGCNFGLRQIRSEYVVLLNNDAVADPEFLLRVLAPFREPGSERVAAITAKVVLMQRYSPRPYVGRALPIGWRRSAARTYAPADDSVEPGIQLINSTGSVVYRSGFAGDRDWLEPADAAPAAADVFGFYGGAAALRTTALDEVGWFDESYFLYYEDVDLSWRLRAAGWLIRYESTAVVTHVHAASSSKQRPLAARYELRNKLLTFTRHAPASVALRACVRALVEIAGRAVLEAPDLTLTRARLRGFAGYLRRLPATMRSRRSWRQAAVPRKQVAKLLAPTRT